MKKNILSEVDGRYVELSVTYAIFFCLQGSLRRLHFLLINLSTNHKRLWLNEMLHIGCFASLLKKMHRRVKKSDGVRDIISPIYLRHRCTDVSKDKTVGNNFPRFGSTGFFGTICH